MSDYGKRYHQAEAHRKSREFREAEEIFRDLWSEYPNPNAHELRNEHVEELTLEGGHKLLGTRRCA